MLWVGIILIVAGWIALSWQALKRMAVKEDLKKIPSQMNGMRLNRYYCLLTIFSGVVMLLLALII